MIDRRTSQFSAAYVTGLDRRREELGRMVGALGKALMEQQTSEERAVPLIEPGRRLDAARAEFQAAWDVRVRQKERRINRLRRAVSCLREWGVS